MDALEDPPATAATGAPPPGDAAQAQPAHGGPPEIEISGADVACIGPILVADLYALFGGPLTPLLVGTHPLLLSAVRGSIAAIIATGSFAEQGRIALWQAAIAPIVVLMWSDPFYYWAGRRYGKRLAGYLAANDPRWRRRIARVERFFARWGVWTILLAYFLPAPSAIFYFFAGETRMRFALFIAADLLGTLAWIAFLITLGWRLGDRGVSVAETVSRYGLYLTIVSLVIVVVASVKRYRSMGRGAR
jgi:membrane protein DedA with SNARE-associated domain